LRRLLPLLLSCPSVAGSWGEALPALVVGSRRPCREPRNG